jgi:Zn finger protein HypA/HybF involved in hydrogenase expression
MIQLKPFKYVCQKCGYSKVVKPKSDVLNPIEMMSICPKCEAKMERKKLTSLDNLLSMFK